MMRRATTLLVVALLGLAVGQEFGGHALFVKTSAKAGAAGVAAASAHSRVQRAAPASPADVMAHNILEWIQGIYTRQGARKIRQQSETNAYLPPYTTQRPPEKPRPFRPATTGGQNDVTNYPYQRPSTLYTPPNPSYPSGQPSSTVSPPYTTRGYNAPGSQQPSSTYVPPSQGYGVSTSYNPKPRPNGPPGYQGSSAFPPLEGSTSYIPPQRDHYPTSPRPQPPSPPTYGYPSQASTGGYPSPGGFTTGGYTSQRPTPGFQTPSPGYHPSSGGYPSPGYPPSSQYPDGGGYPSTPSPSPPFTTPGESTKPPGDTTGADEESTGMASDVDEDLKHPPHIHNIEVQCSKTMMTINIEFNRAFDGVIYSKGYYMNPDCRYVEQNSGQTMYSFTVSLDSCGTQFINDFEGEAGQAYLENVLVLQNEPGIQEVWDTVRRVRCLWEGNINKALSVSLSVDMLNQEIVTFSGDTATAKLDIQIGKGPFAPAADGLVKIGETMTLVVSVEGDPGFDLQVRDCIARDESSTNMVQLTDERGCILKPKFFGAFQKTNDTGNTGASIIAYAFFQAFKFPDVMDLFIECNVELCKTDCEPCPDPNQQIEPGRRRRSITYVAPNTTTTAVLLSDPVRVRRGFRVIMLDDLSTASNQILESMEETAIENISRVRSVCMSNGGFYAAFSLMLSTLVVTSISSVALYLKLQRVHRAKSVQS